MSSRNDPSVEPHQERTLAPRPSPDNLVKAWGAPSDSHLNQRFDAFGAIGAYFVFDQYFDPGY
jgi:hypothetical protein